MINHLEIKEAELSDIPQILQLYAHKDIDNGRVLSEDRATRVFNKFKSYPNYFLYVAMYDEKIVGTFELLIMDNLAHLGKPSGIVEDVVVDKGYRSMGIGRKMMNYALNVCREFGCYKMVLSSNVNRKRAHQFYENLGFKKHGYSFLVEL